MKTARFNFTSTSGHKGSGKVTLKDDGKISITEVYFPRSVSYAVKFQLKEYAKKIVELDFPSDMCFDFKSSETTVGLVNSLIQNTQDLKIAFLAKTKEWSIKMYERAQKFINTPLEEHYKSYDIPYLFDARGVLKMDYTKNTNNYYAFEKDKYQMQNIVAISLEKFVAKREKDAELHYLNSIQKLAMRLNNKGITEDVQYVIQNMSVGENFECLITSGDVIVRAWTIIASGPVQQPHYRYLVK